MSCMMGKSTASTISMTTTPMATISKGSSTMASLVEELVTRYTDRIVLFDSPPLHAASETAILAQQVDGGAEDGIEVRKSVTLAVYQGGDAAGSTLDDFDDADDRACFGHDLLQMQKAARLLL